MDPSKIQNDIKKLQEEYYKTNTKNSFFKNKQKLECAETITQSYDINVLLNNTVYIIPGTNSIFFDYTVFKMFANPSNYSVCIQHITNTINYMISTNESYNVHINLISFTITAYERYKQLIIDFCNICLNHSLSFYAKLNKIYIYNTPNMFDTITKLLSPFVDPTINSKMITYNKTGTNDILIRSNNSFIEYITKLK